MRRALRAHPLKRPYDIDVRRAGKTGGRSADFEADEGCGRPSGWNQPRLRETQ
jgi:hypothetical protein